MGLPETERTLRRRKAGSPAGQGEEIGGARGKRGNTMWQNID